MKNIKSYSSFLNERSSNKITDIVEILDLIKDKPMEDIIELRDAIEEVSELSDVSESLNEGFIQNIKDRIRKKFDDVVWKYIINRKKSFYYELIDNLNIFDLTTLDDVKGFKRLNSLYLAGGMDKAKDVGAGWRHVLEAEFEKYGKVVDDSLPKVDVGFFGEFQPKHIVDGIYLDMFLENPRKVKKLYDPPLLLNPVRKEVDRTKDKDFAEGARKYKSFTHETEPEEYEPTMTSIKRTMTRSIEVDDEHLVRLSDGVFLGLNQAAAAGTYGELQMQSFLNKPIFVWMTDEEWEFKDFSMWTFPHISKLARNEKEMKILVKTIYDSLQ